MVTWPMAEVDIAAIFGWSLALIVLLVLLFLLVTGIRKWMRADDPAAGAGFTLSELRQFHKSGQMSNEEFEKAKEILLATMGKTPVKASPTPGLKRNPTDPPVA